MDLVVIYSFVLVFQPHCGHSITFLRTFIYVLGNEEVKVTPL